MTQAPLFGDLEPRTHARRGDPDTSHDAAARLANQRSMMRRLLVTYLERPRTADEATDAAGYDAASGAWKRISDLDGLGLISDTGDRRPGRSGRLQIVRAITEKGLDTL